MIITEGDLLTSPVQIIAHQTNCQGIMNGGIARQIRSFYPEVYTNYVEFVKSYKDCNGKPPLGECLYVETADKSHIVLNLFGQDRYGRDKRYTDYEALKKSFVDGILQLRYEFLNGEYENDLQLTIGIPYGIGCGLAGGDWNVVSKMLEDIEHSENVLFIAYKI